MQNNEKFDSLRLLTFGVCESHINRVNHVIIGFSLDISASYFSFFLAYQVYTGYNIPYKIAFGHSDNDLL